MGVESATKRGHRAALVALRTELAQKIDAQPGARDLAALAKQLVEVLDKIAALDGPTVKPAEGASASDDLARKREQRLAAAAGS